MVKYYLTSIFLLLSLLSRAALILIPMDETRKNHLKSYGKYAQPIENECRVRGISYEVITDSQVNAILTEIASPEINMEMVKLETPAKIAVYSPNNVFTTKDYTDAVQLALEYAEIPYDIIYDEEILKGDLPKYEWLHLHHEDLTGQFGLSGQRQSQEDINIQKSIATRQGYTKVSLMKLTVAKNISNVPKKSKIHPAVVCKFSSFRHIKRTNK